MKTDARTVLKKRITNTEVPKIRAKLAKKQGGICPLCERPLRPNDTTLDHCHTTGYLRAALCRNCNGIEGKISNLLVRMDVAKIGHSRILLNIIKLHDPKNLKKKWIHPAAETLKENRERKNRRARQLYAAKKRMNK